MRTLSLLCILILAITCNKIEKTTPIPNPIAQEEAIKFSLNLTNTSSNYILEVDSLIGNINITSKIPKDGISINLTLKRTDSNLIVWTKDTTVSSLNINFTIKNLNKELKYTLVSVVTSKTTATNSSTLSVDFQRIFPISQKRFNITIDISNVEGKTSIQSGEYQGGTELEIKAIPNDMITPKVNAIPQTNNGSSTDNPEECDDSFLEDAAFDDISKISSALGLVDESTPCLNGVSPDSMLEELAFCGEINWAGLALSTLTLSQFRTFSKDKPKRVRPIKVGA